MKKSIWKYKKIHMIGVKGVGMTALAEVLLANGFFVRGSDIQEHFMTDEVLARLNVPVTDFSAAHIQGSDAVVHSNAYNAENNEEMKAAQDAHMPIFSYPEVVAEFFNAHHGIAVAGSHGKTTTTAMLSHLLQYAERNVISIVGSKVVNWGCGAIAGDLKKQDALFVLEADEYKEAFLNYHPKGAIITNIDYDHPDYYRRPEDYQAAFVKFAASIAPTGFLVIGDSDAALAEIARSAACKVIVMRKDDMAAFALQTPGEHNQQNANLAYRVALELGVPAHIARAGLEDFKGTSRRLEYIGESHAAPVFDDYAHHPTEIRATLGALKAKYPKKRIVAIFQPHTYSRTKALFNDFAAAFSDAETVVLAGVYASAREKKEGSGNGVDMEAMTAMINKKKKKAVFIEDIAQIPAYIAKRLGADAVAVTLGAGDIWQVGKALVGCT
ncbi:UDP-N-acetylmuramate--L-alanine ligase [Candidatus Azambacteria bacterium]|nr:UDP-N-acetylmuramate--L-alanine ligase [Candidatus Azambacteria bacterium]